MPAGSRCREDPCFPREPCPRSPGERRTPPLSRLEHTPWDQQSTGVCGLLPPARRVRQGGDRIPKPSPLGTRGLSPGEVAVTLSFTLPSCPFPWAPPRPVPAWPGQTQCDGQPSLSDIGSPTIQTSSPLGICCCLRKSFWKVTVCHCHSAPSQEQSCSCERSRCHHNLDSAAAMTFFFMIFGL